MKSHNVFAIQSLARRAAESSPHGLLIHFGLPRLISDQLKSPGLTLSLRHQLPPIPKGAGKLDVGMEVDHPIIMAQLSEDEVEIYLALHTALDMVTKQMSELTLAMKIGGIPVLPFDYHRMQCAGCADLDTCKGSTRYEIASKFRESLEPLELLKDLIGTTMDLFLDDARQAWTDSHSNASGRFTPDGVFVAATGDSKTLYFVSMCVEPYEEGSDAEAEDALLDSIAAELMSQIRSPMTRNGAHAASNGADLHTGETLAEDEEEELPSEEALAAENEEEPIDEDEPAQEHEKVLHA